MTSADTLSSSAVPRTGSGWRARLRRIALSGAIFLVSCIVALFLGELCVRLFARQQVILKRPDVWRPAVGIGWTHWPNVRTTVNTGEREVPYQTDKEGFRVGASGRVEGDKKILLLGDSFMEALQVPYEQSMAGFLEAKLPAAVGKTVAVRNTGVGGYSPSQYLLQARQSLAKDHFDLVLVAVFLGNDIEPARHDSYSPRAPTTVHHLRLPTRLSVSELIDAVLYPINDALEVRSHLFILFKNVTTTLRMRLGLSYLELPEEVLKREATDPKWNVTAGVLRDIAAVADSSGTPTIVVLLPSAYQVEPKELEQFAAAFKLKPEDIDLDQPNRIMLQDLHDQGLTVIDATPSLRQAVKESTVPLYGAVDVHFSPRGHEVATDAILPTVVDRLTRTNRASMQVKEGGKSKR